MAWKELINDIKIRIKEAYARPEQMGKIAGIIRSAITHSQGA